MHRAAVGAALRRVRIHSRRGSASLLCMLEMLVSTWAGTGPKQAALPATLAGAAKQLLPSLIAILIVLTALGLPVLLIVWRLHRAYN